jgi:hypothetical protein
MPMKYGLLIIAIVFNTANVYTQDTLPIVVFEDTPFRHVDTNMVHDIANEVNKLKTEKQLVPRFPKRNTDHKAINNQPLNVNFIDGVIEIMAYCLGATFLIALFYFIFRDLNFRKSISAVNEEDLDNIENIDKVNFDQLYIKAMEAGNLRLALRIRFLILLQKLQRGGYIEWKPNKTNRTYANELSKHENIIPYFKKLSLAFEKIWYGNFSLNKFEFDELLNQFYEMDKTLVK